MKYKKYIIYGICIALICSFIVLRQRTIKSNDNLKSTTVTNDTNKNKTTSENNTKSKDGLYAEVNKTEPPKGKITNDITMAGTTPNTEGNSSGNLLNGGYFAKQGKWIYFTLPPANYKLHPIYRVMTDGETGLKAITKEGNFRCINVISDWVYYLDDKSGSYIFRTKTDGSLTEVVVEYTAFRMLIKDNFIYYSSPEGIYKLKLNSSKGDKGTLITKRQVFTYMSIYNNLIYNSTYEQATNLSNDTVTVTRLNSMNLDGSNFKKLSNDNIINFVIYNDYIFYINYNDQRLYRMNLNGSNKIYLFPYTIQNFNISNDNIYFTGKDQNNIYKSDLNGKGITKITNNIFVFENNNRDNSIAINYITSISIVNDNIFFFGESESGQKLYKVKLDGSFEKQLN
ncbi:DUF5050 domain-containing protein [Candidatus Clostridium radicumherbarum]|uniref:DUF5050 domain-containing protein n=1 Tax=Candidatus Clostridium radicumherbarum TaxID=3381662 RepID=A0ABW8TLV2_9CLOT